MENPLGKRRVQRRSFQIITSVFFKKKRKTQAKKKKKSSSPSIFLFDVDWTPRECG
jgi:hypothetical protein